MKAIRGNWKKIFRNPLSVKCRIIFQPRFLQRRIVRIFGQLLLNLPEIKAGNVGTYH